MPLNRAKYERRVHFVKMIPKAREVKADHDDYGAAAQGQVGLFAEKVGEVLDQQGVYADLRHQYLAYAEALDKSQRELDWMVDLIREHRILRDRFQRRNLDPAVLDAIDRLVIYRRRNR